MTAHTLTQPVHAAACDLKAINLQTFKLICFRFQKKQRGNIVLFYLKLVCRKPYTPCQLSHSFSGFQAVTHRSPHFVYDGSQRTYMIVFELRFSNYAYESAYSIIHTTVKVKNILRSLNMYLPYYVYPQRQLTYIHTCNYHSSTSFARAELGEQKKKACLRRTAGVSTGTYSNKIALKNFKLNLCIDVE